MRQILRGRDDRGFGAIDVLVALAVMTVVGGVITALLVASNHTSRRATAGVTTEGQLLDAVSRITRDIAVSDPIIQATPSLLTVQQLRGEDCVRTRYQVEEDPARQGVHNLVSTTWLLAGQACPPADQGMPQGSKQTSQVIVRDLTTTDLFTYFDQANDRIDPEPTTGEVNPAQITRVGVNVAANVKERPGGMRLETSIAPRSGLTDDGTPNEDALTPPAAPILTAQDVCADTVTLSWNAVPGATGYLIVRDGVTIKVVDASQTSYVDGPLAPGATYAYQVYAQSPGGLSDNPITHTVTRCPAAPVLSGETLRGQGSEVDSNRLSWTRPAGATGYTLYRDGTPIASISDPATTEYLDQDVEWGTRYDYTVTARNAGGESEHSNLVSLLLRPAAPKLTGEVVGSSNTHRLTWTRPTSATSYRVYREGSLVTTTTDPTTTATDSRPWGSRTNYHVTAVNAAGESNPSNIVNGTIRPAAPTLSGKMSSTTATLQWPAQPGATEYRLLRNGSEIYRGSALSYTDTGRPSGSTNTYVLYAINYHLNYPNTGDVNGVTSYGGGQSDASNTITLVVAPAAPTITAAKMCLCRENHNGQITWTAVPGATQYVIIRNGTQIAAVSGSTTTYYDTTALADGSTHSYQVFARNAGGDSPRSAAVSVTAPPAAPTLSASQESGRGPSVNLSWTKVPSATHYLVYRNGVLIANTTATSLNNPTVRGTQYRYRVFAVNATDISPSSNEVAITPLWVRAEDDAKRVSYSDPPSGGLGISTSGSYYTNAVLAYCFDLNSKEPQTGGGYGNWSFWDANNSYRVHKQVGWDVNFSGGGYTGPGLSATEVERLGYVLNKWGATSDAVVAAAVDHFVRTQTFHGSAQETRMNQRWSAVKRDFPAAVGHYNTMRDEVDNYRGPYTVTITQNGTPKVGQSSTVTIRVTSATGKGVPGVKVAVRLSSANQPGQGIHTTDSSGRVTLTYSPDCPGTMTISAAAIGLAPPGVWIAWPNNSYAQRMMTAFNTTLSKSITVSVAS